MKNLIQTAVVTLFAASAAQAQQAVQWKVSDGGNGHWYAYFATPKQWAEAKPYAESLGGHLVTVQSAAEATFVRTLGGDTCWIGLFQDRAAPDYSEPLGGWRWVTGEPLDFTFWRVNTNGQPNEPNNLSGGEDWAHLDANATTWNDLPDGPYPFAVEWDADCNNDGEIDFGQILVGELPDTNGNGIPDCCENGGTCCIGDIFRDGQVNGGDLGIMLSYWGPVTSSSASRACDLNQDDRVDGSDLGFLLANWGTCPG